MRVLTTAIFSMIAFSLSSALPIKAEDKESCTQPGRIESAMHIIAQAKDFKLKASQYHLNANETVDKAKRLKGEADKLKARVGAVDASAPQEYKANLQAFKDHAASYRAHLDRVEHDLGYCKASEAAYQAQLKEYSLHVDTFHMPNIRPPHVCGEMGVTERQAGQIANTLRADQVRVARSEQDLASAENSLENAMQASIHSDTSVYHRSKLAEEERKLAGEFAGLKTEYELLATQRNALLGSSTDTTAAIKTVHAKVKK
ncbi:MAG: hypothetical protein K2X81_05085 [Candidatus Obscuribacterales bacterium]|nr:hypothetical protein [Candidatus Obscuribacterales bacterium]